MINERSNLDKMQVKIIPKVDFFNKPLSNNYYCGRTEEQSWEWKDKYALSLQ